MADHGLAVLVGLGKEVPGPDTLGFFLRQPRGTETVFHGFQCDFDLVALDNGQFAVLVVEFIDGDHAFGLQARVDDHDIVLYFQHLSVDEGTGLHGATLQTLLE